MVHSDGSVRLESEVCDPAATHDDRCTAVDAMTTVCYRSSEHCPGASRCPARGRDGGMRQAAAQD